MTLPADVARCPGFGRLEFRADPEFIEKIQELADEDNVTKAEIVRRAIGLYSYAARLAQQGQVLAPQAMNNEQDALPMPAKDAPS